MNEDFIAPYLDHKIIDKKAKEFLDRYNPDSIIPTPIEEIVEFDLHLNIIPLPDLLTIYDVDAFTSRDLKAITVDEGQSIRYPNRYRFSLAHEVGHIVLHSELFKRAQYNSNKEYLSFYNTLLPEESDKLEYQANYFAGSILVPFELLKQIFSAGITKLKEEAGYESSEQLMNSPEFLSYISTWIGRRFEVSKGTIIRRLRYSGLIDKNTYY